MSANDSSLGSLNYLPAQVKHNAHGWQVEYHALDPTTGKLKRHVTKLNSLRKRYDRISKRIGELVKGAARNWYLIGDGYAPGPKPVSNARFRKDWDKMRKELGLPQEMQLYSLRDTGINEMLKGGIDPLTVMQHADHHDLAMTTRYANHADPHLVSTIRERAPKF